MAKEM